MRQRRNRWVTLAHRAVSYRKQKGRDAFFCPTRRHMDLHHVYPDQEGGGAMLPGRESHCHQLVIMRYIEPDRRRIDARSLKATKENREPGGRGGRDHDFLIIKRGDKTERGCDVQSKAFPLLWSRSGSRRRKLLAARLGGLWAGDGQLGSLRREGRCV